MASAKPATKTDEQTNAAIAKLVDDLEAAGFDIAALAWSMIGHGAGILAARFGRRYSFTALDEARAAVEGESRLKS